MRLLNGLSSGMRLYVLASTLILLAGCTSTRSTQLNADWGRGTQESGAEEFRCTLTPEQLAERRRELIPGLFDRATMISDIPDGIRFQFAPEPGLLEDLARVIAQEQTCCSFLRFDVTTEPSTGSVAFDVTGPPGAVAMLRKL